VRDTELLNSVVEAIANTEGRMDGLVAAAGIQQETPALEYSAKDSNTMFEVNVTGVFMTAQAVAKQMIRFGNGGSIAMIASMSGTVANRVCSPSPPSLPLPSFPPSPFSIYPFRLTQRTLRAHTFTIFTPNLEISLFLPRVNPLLSSRWAWSLHPSPQYRLNPLLHSPTFHPLHDPSQSNHLLSQGLICPAYNASKAAVIQLGRNLAAEWGQYNIRVNTISPGYIVTQMVEKLFVEFPERRDQWPKENMLGRLSRPEEYRGAAVFLLSDASSFMTGSDLRMDGGHAAW
jgi:NAD(P)-dependent dehydrogenase (short-subunit alcohol dehydrogenase family)